MFRVPRRRPVAVILAVAATLLAQVLLAGCGGDPDRAATSAPTQPAATVVKVWFPDEQGDLVAESRPVPAGESPLSAALAALAAGPARAGLMPGLPAGTRVLAAEVAGGVAVVDLSDRFAPGYPEGGSAAEIAAVGPVVLTAAAASGAPSVRLLVDGRAPDLPDAQLDLSQPLTPRDVGGSQP